MTQQNLKRSSYTVLVIPGVLVYGAIIVFPIIFSFGISFFKWSGLDTPLFVGISNYLEIFKDKIFWMGLRNNILIVLVSLFGQIPLGFFLAYILYRKLVKCRNFFETMIFFPIAISVIVVAILWNQIFSSQGIFTAIIRIIVDDPRWVVQIFESRNFAIVPILFVLLWMYTGMYMIIFIANLQKISPSVIEAVIIDGASESQILIHIILPSMINIIMTCAIFAITGSLRSFDLIFSMTSGGPAHYTEVIAIYMYRSTFRYYKYGYGSAISMVIVFLSIGLISVLKATFGRFERKFEE